MTAVRTIAVMEQGLILPVAVNLSTQDLHDPQLPDIIITLLASWGLAPQNSPLTRSISGFVVVTAPPDASTRPEHRTRGDA